MKRGLIAGGAIVAGSVLMLSLAWGLQHAALSSPQVLGRPAPALTIQPDGGQALSVSALQGKPVVVNFWASWCEPCKQEQNDLNQIAKLYQPRGVVFLGVNVLDTQRDALGFLQNYTVGYSVVQDATGSVYINYGVVGVPETYLVTRQGTIGQKIVGPVDPQALASSLEVLSR